MSKFTFIVAWKQIVTKLTQSGTSKKEWQKYEIQSIYMSGSSGEGFFVQQRRLIPPYGDDPRDQEWIKAGFKYWFINIKNN